MSPGHVTQMAPDKDHEDIKMFRAPRLSEAGNAIK
jgi:hypothetical protein